MLGAQVRAPQPGDAARLELQPLAASQQRYRQRRGPRQHEPRRRRELEAQPRRQLDDRLRQLHACRGAGQALQRQARRDDRAVRAEAQAARALEHEVSQLERQRGCQVHASQRRRKPEPARLHHQPAPRRVLDRGSQEQEGGAEKRRGRDGDGEGDTEPRGQQEQDIAPRIGFEGCSVSIVVQKYGGSSVADVGRIQQVADKVAAARAGGREVVVVVSAMGDTTDELLGARPPGLREPGSPRTRHAALGRRAHLDGARLDGAQRARRAGGQLHRLAVRHRHERRPHERAHRRGAAVPRAGRARPRPGRDRGRLPGRVVPQGGDDARPRRLRHHRSRARRGARRRLRDLQRRRRRLHRRPACRTRRAAARADRPTRRCRSWPRPAPGC